MLMPILTTLAAVLVLGSWWAALRGVGVRGTQWLTVLVLVTAVASGRWWLAARFGSPMPFWDQWDAEWRSLLLPAINGDLGVHQLFSTHNEHRIVFTRIQAWFLFSVAGAWSPVLEMLFNCVLHGMAVALVVAFLVSSGTAAAGPVLVGAIAAAIAPMQWESVLAGFQSQFSYLLLFATAAMVFTLKSVDGYRYTLAATLCMVAGLGTVAGSALTAALCLGLMLLRSVSLREWPSQSALVTMLAALIVFVIGVLTTPTIASHQPLRAQSVLALAEAFTRNLGWLYPEQHWLALWLAVVAVWLPIGWLVVRALVGGGRTTLSAMPVIAVAGWVLLQTLAIAISRGADGSTPASRYLDMLSLSLPCALAALGFLIPTSQTARRWVLISVTGIFALFYFERLPSDWGQAEGRAVLQERHVQVTREFLSGERDSLSGLRPLLDLAHPSAALLEEALSDKRLLRSLDSRITAGLPPPGRGSGSGFAAPGHYADNKVMPLLEGSVGSYVPPRGDTQQGRWLTPTYRYPTEEVELLVSGYPAEPGMGIRLLLDNGRSVEVPVEGNPGEAWNRVRIRTQGLPFQLELTDESTSRWLAIGPPAPMLALERLLRVMMHAPWRWLGVACGLAMIALGLVAGRERAICRAEGAAARGFA